MAGVRTASSNVLSNEGVGVKHIVIVGGGFAGVKLARELQDDRRFQITVISARANFEYHAALYRSATGRSHMEVAVPLTEIFADTDVEVVINPVAKIDSKKKTVTCEDGQSYAYDDLVLALGTVTAYFGIKGLPEYSYGIKTIDEAMYLKNHLHAELTTGHKPDLNYVVVGGGPSGVELAGELESYLKKLRRNHNIKKPFHVDLVEAAPRILPVMPERFSAAAEKRLKRLGVRVYTSTAVKGETADALQLPNGDINTHTVIWTAGMTGSPLFGSHPKLFNLGKGGKVTVDASLSAGDNIWIAGDSALTAKAGWAQTAIYDGGYLARNFKRREHDLPPAPYKVPAPVGAIPVGPNWCGVSMNGLQVFGFVGWAIRRFYDFKLYRQVLPFGLAVRSWLMGNKVEETCSVCRSRA
jgi:NADH dehydrogenase